MFYDQLFLTFDSNFMFKPNRKKKKSVIWENRLCNSDQGMTQWEFLRVCFCISAFRSGFHTWEIGQKVFLSSYMVSEEKNGLGLGSTKYLLLFAEIPSITLFSLYTPDNMEIKKIFTSHLWTITLLYQSISLSYWGQNIFEIFSTSHTIMVQKRFFVYFASFVILTLCKG